MIIGNKEFLPQVPKRILRNFRSIKLFVVEIKCVSKLKFNMGCMIKPKFPHVEPEPDEEMSAVGVF